jgi:cobalt/nickel transport system permease protein
MLLLDYYAHHNRLRRFSPTEKVVLAVSGLAISLAWPSPVAAAEVAVFMAALALAGARIPLRLYLRLALLPLSFLLPGALATVLTLSFGPPPAGPHLSLGSLCLGVAGSELPKAAALVLRSYAAVLCLNFLALTTPAAEIMGLLRLARVPGFVLELIGLVYRSLVVLYETAERIYVSQAARQGYCSLSSSRRSLGILAVNLFWKAQVYSRLSFQAMLARGGDDDAALPLIPNIPWSFSLENLLFILASQSAILAGAALWGGFPRV